MRGEKSRDFSPDREGANSTLPSRKRERGKIEGFFPGQGRGQLHAAVPEKVRGEKSRDFFPGREGVPSTLLFWSKKILRVWFLQQEKRFSLGYPRRQKDTETFVKLDT